MKRHRWTDEELIQVAKKYKHKGDWKRSANRLDAAAYQTALARPKVYAEATAQMTPKASPYSGSYVVYGYEFADHHVYIGLTFLPQSRRAQHMQRGPVHKHMKVCASYAAVILDKGISEPDLVADIECYWIETYKEAGWILLNERKGGGLGTIQRTKWTREAVLDEALKYQTKQEWIDKSQMSYRIAKREGWFDAASAHMPKRVLGIGAGVPKSAAAKKKMRQAKLGKPQSAAAKAAKSEAIRKWWAARKAGST